MTTSPKGAFVRAIVEDPLDIDLRLIFADWLSENGEEDQAEFIRMQCELTRLHQSAEWHTPHPLQIHETAARERTLRRRERELIARVRGHPLEELPRGNLTFRSHGLDCEFRRGFIEIVTCTCASWLKHGPALVQLQPVLKVRLTNTILPELTSPVAWARHEAGLPPLKEATSE